jgi:hypothetical protein
VASFGDARRLTQPSRQGKRDVGSRRWVPIARWVGVVRVFPKLGGRRGGNLLGSHVSDQVSSSRQGRHVCVARKWRFPAPRACCWDSGSGGALVAI